MLVGILAIQGSREEHAGVLKKLGVDFLFVRTSEELAQVDALIIPGGESTTIGMLMRRNKLHEALKKAIKNGLPVYGTCAGAILLAKEIVGEQQADTLGVMDVAIVRNAYGPQLDSFVTELKAPALGKVPLEAVFIRAPKIAKIGKNVEVLAEHEREPVLVRENNMLISTFHPELTDDIRIHKYFLSFIKNAV